MLLSLVSPMSRFLLKLSLFAALQVVMLGGLFFRAKAVDESEYMAATIDKHHRAESLEGRRMLIIGGSNIAFGIDTPRLEREFGLPAVNMGLNANLGAEFMLAEAEATARSGDVLLVSLEYEHFAAPSTLATVVMRLFEHRPESMAFLNARQRKDLMESGLPYLHTVVHRGVRNEKRKKRTEVSKKNAYLREAFNAHGDVIAHEAIPAEYDAKKSAPTEMRAMWQNGVPGVIDKDYMTAAVERFNHFVQRCEARGIRVLLAAPPRSETSAGNVRGVMDAIHAAIAGTITAPTVTDERSLVFRDELFFDSCYHLTGEGKRQRMDLLIEGLSRYLPRMTPEGNPSTPTRPPMMANDDGEPIRK